MIHLTKKIILEAIKYSASLNNSFISGWWICNEDNTAFLPLLQVARRVYNDEFDYAEELDYAEEFKKLGINVRLKKIARICWNTNGWTCPSGRIGKSKNKDSYEYKYGFGHEEWLFDIAKTIKGYHYGHIQAVATYKENLPFDISLFTINDKTRQRYWVGEILDVEPVFNKEAKTILSEYKKKGWYAEMQEQLKDYIEKIPTGFAFNLRYRPENLRKYDILKPVDRKEPNVKTSYYTSLYNLKTIFKPEDHFVFQPGYRTEGTEIDVPNGSSHRSHISKRHPVIQKVLYDYLVKEYGNGNVGTENSTSIGTEIDIVTKHGDEYDLYEIKTALDIRLCIREALSQLLEYGLYRTDIKVRNNDMKEMELSISHENPQLLPMLFAMHDVRNSYKQISFTMDFDTSIKGYASPLIWGVYGDKNKGVCIELDYEKLNLPSSYFCDIVEYTNNTNHRIKISNDVVSVTSLKSFIREHQKELFFLKDKCWEYENEYRIISDSDEYLDISNAITAVYVADLDGLAFEIVDAMLKNTDVTFGYVHLDKDSGVLFSSDARLYKDSINSPLSDPRNCLLSISKQAKEHYESLKKHPDADLTKVEYKI